MKITEILEIITIWVILVVCALSVVNLKHQMRQIECKLTILESNYQHLLHRMNAIEYPEVLGREVPKASNSDG